MHDHLPVLNLFGRKSTFPICGAMNPEALSTATKYDTIVRRFHLRKINTIPKRERERHPSNGSLIRENTFTSLRSICCSSNLSVLEGNTVVVDKSSV